MTPNVNLRNKDNDVGMAGVTFHVIFGATSLDAATVNVYTPPRERTGKPP